MKTSLFRKFSAVVLVLVGLVVMSGAPVATKAEGSGIHGLMLISPTCPSYNPCPDQPYQGPVTVKTDDGSTVEITQVSGNESGQFSLDLPAGTYSVEVQPAMGEDEEVSSTGFGFGFGGAQEVTVYEGDVTQVVFTFDTGMR